MGATIPNSASATSAASASITLALAGGVAVGDNQYAIVESSTTDPHVWPAAWTVLFASAGEAGYVSIAKRLRQAGDTNPTVSNGGHSANWAYTEFFVEGTGGHTPTVVASASHVDASGTTMTVPTLPETQDQYTLIWLASAQVSDVPASDPFDFVLGVASAPLVFWRPFVTPGSVGYTIPRTTSRPTVSYLLVLQEAISAEADLIVDVPTMCLSFGYNIYPVVQQGAGGSIQVT